MTVLRYEPWGLRLFSTANTSESDGWVPATDIHEEPSQFVLHLDLPGVDAQAVEITAEKGYLTIRGTREPQARENGDGYRRVERTSGKFQRRFSLPDSADAQNIRAKATNGVLEVVIPKVAEVQPRKIMVAAA